jgi:hypothetical protein
MYNEHFKLPIYYNDKKVKLKQNIIDDLELVKTVDSSCNSIYSYYVNNSNELSTNVINQISEYYTTDTDFLKDNQTLFKTYNKSSDANITKYSDYTNILSVWNNIKSNTEFKEKYHYITWSMFNFLNTSDIFLQWLTIANISSPFISLIMPIIMMIIPLIFLKLRGVNMSINQYVNILKCIPQSNNIMKLCTSGNIHDKIYPCLSIGFYIFSFYQNIMLSINSYKNIINIHKYLKEVELYLEYTVNSMTNYLAYSQNLPTFKEFNNVVNDKIQILTDLKNKLQKISDMSFFNFTKIFEIGYVLKCFYELYENKIYNDAIMYSFGFNGYVDCVEGLVFNIKNGHINFCEFIDNSKKMVFKNSYHASLKNDKHVKNTIKFNKNMILSGPNASGKTTLLKNTLINIICSQQFGCGFYEDAKVHPFKYLHCYLNIPDTSGRDSLFQAEARRCKEILDTIDANKGDTHFCAFDEIYSGTNPEEAVATASSFLTYLNKNKNVSYILTTHFLKVCKKLKNNKNILNCNMHTIAYANDVKYTYSLKKGISKIKGGVNVLKQLNYPSEIIQNAI